MSNRKVLLVDGDLRKPRLDKILKITYENGLANYLEGTSTIDDLIIDSEIENLSFIPSGKIEFNSSELLNNGRIKTFFDFVREQYDYVIVDNSPVGIVFDPVLIGAHADLNLVLLRLNHSKKGELVEIVKMNEDGVFPKVVVAVNGIKQKQDYGYYTEEGKSDDNTLVDKDPNENFDLTDNGDENKVQKISNQIYSNVKLGSKKISSHVKSLSEKIKTK